MNNNDVISFNNIIEWKKIDEYGQVVDSGILHNKIQNLVKEELIDALDDKTTFYGEIVAMAVGTGTGASSSAAALVSKVSNALLSSQTQPTSTSLQNVASFTSLATTIKEAGLFPVSDCTTNMYFYNDSLNVALTSSDTLQITWTVNVTGT